MKNKPNFFIIGAPKCGTTSLSEYLRTHPNVFFTRPKEPRYFANDIYRPLTEFEDYVALFNKVSENHLAIGEGSAIYLISKVAIGNIKEFAPGAKLIAMIRNPIQMIPSLHSQLLISLNENEEDFEKAWGLQESRREGKNIPKTCRTPIFLQYAYVGRLGSQLERLFQTYDRKLVKVIIFDDFVKSTKNVYEDTLAFLGLPSDGKGEFPKFRANKISRSQTVSRFVRRPPKPLKSVYFKTKKFFNLGTLGLFRRIKSMNSKEAKRKTVSQEMKQELVETFREDILLMSDLLDRDLTHWLEV